MITVAKQDNGVLFTFENSDKYLYGSGTIEVPFNSLSIIQDESDMITLRKAASNDIFLAARYDTDFGYRSKEEAVEALKGMLFAETGGGSGSGVTPSEVQEMIDESVSGKADTAVVNQAISEVWDTIDEKEEVIASALTEVRQDVADIDAKEEVIASALTEVRQDVNTLSGDVQTKVATSDFNAYSAATDARIAEDEEVTAAALNNLNENKQDALSAGTGIEISGNVISATGGGGVTVDPTLDTGSTNPVANSAITTAINDLDNNKLSNVQVDAKTPTSDYTQLNLYCQRKNGGYQNLFTYVKTINGESVTTQSTNNIQGFSLVETSAITSSITSASTNSEVAGAKAVYDAIQAGGGGGGATYSAGTNISIDTANTINCTIPLIVTGTSSIKQASNSSANSTLSAVFGRRNNISKSNLNYIFMAGNNNTASNDSEAVFGVSNENNMSSSTFGNSGNTLFAVGNGSGDFSRHNALDIRQNGDIYFPDTDNTTSQNFYEKPMVRLQDMYAALGGLKLVKLTQAEYSAMEQAGTLDSNTLYIVTNVVS